MCPSCQELDVEFEIRTPGELAKAIRVVQANIADGTLKPIYQVAGQPFATVQSDGPWADVLAYAFRCATCGTQFELSAETYHGAGGAWRRRSRRKHPIVLFAILAVGAIVAGSIWWPRNHPMPYTLDYDRLIHLDAEDLAETGIAEAYQTLQAELRKYVPEPARVEESTDDTAPRYSVTCRGREFLIYGPGDEVESWGRATFAFFALVNDQLTHSQYRLYAINGGHDLGGMFLTEAQAQAARDALPNKSDWPYLPDNRPPFYGQPH